MINWVKKLGAVRQKSLFYSCFFSYLLILLMPVLASLLIYKNMGASIEQETNKANEALLTQLQMSVDMQIDDINNIIEQLSSNTRVKAAGLIQGEFQPKDRFNLYLLFQEIKKYSMFERYYDDMCIFFNNTGTVMNDKGHISIPMFYNLYLKGADLSEADLRTFSETTKGRGIRLLSFEDGKRLILFSQNVAIPESSYTVPATTFVIMNAEKLQETLDSMKWKDENIILIINENNEIIAATSDSAWEFALDYNNLESGNRKINQTDYTLSVRQSLRLDWKCVIITPTSVFYEDARSTQLLSLLGILGCILVCTALSYHFARKNINPFTVLVSALQKDKSREAVPATPQFQWILKAVEELVQEKESASHKLYRHTLMVKSSLINKLLKDVYNPDSLEAEMAEAGLMLPGQHYVVMLFKIEDVGEKLRSDKNHNDLNLANFVVMNFFQEVIENTFMVETAEIEEYAATVVCLPSDSRMHLDVLENAAYEVQQEAAALLSIQVAITIGSIYEGTRNLHNSYREALEALEYHYLVEENGVIVYDRIKNQQKKYYYPMEKELRIQNAIKAGNGKAAQEYISDVFDQNLDSEGQAPELLRLLLADLASTVVKSLDDEEEAGVAEEVKKILQLPLKMCSPQSCQEFLTIVDDICNYNRQKWDMNNKPDSLCLDVEAYIQEHYADPNLSISLIGESFGLTPGYLSKRFKEMNKEGLLEHINSVRVEKAKELLQEDIPLNEVCMKVGYTNVGTFIRVFKKVYGVTPGQSKKIL